MDYRDVIIIEPAKLRGEPGVRALRITSTMVPDCLRRGNCCTNEIATPRRAREAIASLVADPDLGMLLLA